MRLFWPGNFRLLHVLYNGESMEEFATELELAARSDYRTQFAHGAQAPQFLLCGLCNFEWVLGTEDLESSQSPPQIVAPSYILCAIAFSSALDLPSVCYMPLSGSLRALPSCNNRLKDFLRIRAILCRKMGLGLVFWRFGSWLGMQHGICTVAAWHAFKSASCVKAATCGCGLREAAH